MGSLSARRRAAVVVAFVLSAGLASGAAVALVKAGDEERSPGRTLPRVTPTLISTSERPSPAASPAPTATTAPSPTSAPSVSTSPSASARPAGTASASPKPRAPRGATYLSAKADLVPVSESAFQLVIRATDGDDRVTLSSVKWGDGASASSTGGARCSAPSGADCRVFTLEHAYAQAATDKTYAITVLVTAGKEKVLLTLHAEVARLAPEPSPSASPAPSPTQAP